MKRTSVDSTGRTRGKIAARPAAVASRGVRRALAACVVAALLAAPSGPAKAGGPGDKGKGRGDGKGFGDGGGDCGGGVGTLSAPELDPGSMAGALAVLTGGALIWADRRRR